MRVKVNRLTAGWVMLAGLAATPPPPVIAQELRCGPANRGRPSADGTHCECVAPILRRAHGRWNAPMYASSTSPAFASGCILGVHMHRWTSVGHEREFMCLSSRRAELAHGVGTVPRSMCGWRFVGRGERSECVCGGVTPDFDRLQNRCVARRGATGIPAGTTSNTCPSGMVLVPSGSTDGNAVSSFCIDRTEVTVASYWECVNLGACGNADTPSPQCNYGRNGMDNHPMNCVDWTNAARFCQWRNARLPTNWEWRFAAQGMEDRISVGQRGAVEPVVLEWGQLRARAHALYGLSRQVALHSEWTIWRGTYGSGRSQ